MTDQKFARESRFPKAIILGLMLCFMEGIALFNALPGMDDAIWQDEAVTIMYSSARGIAHPFLDYSSPNDHMLFSSMMAGWVKLFPGGVDIFSLRLLPLLLFLTALPTTFFAALRLGGPACAVVAGLLFASSTVTANFAVQLRGYGPSWLFFSVALLSALHVKDSPSPVWRTLYFLSCMGAVAILPTNFFLALGIGTAVGLSLLVGHGCAAPGTRSTIAVLCLSPVAGLLAYAAVWRQLVEHGQVSWSSWTRTGVLRNWLESTTSDFMLLVPLMGGALLLAGVASIRRHRAGQEPVTDEFRLVIFLLLSFVASVVAIPKAPFPRTLVPFLPVWYCLLAFLITYGFKLLRDKGYRTWYLGGVALTGVLILANLPLQSCRSADRRSAGDDYDLCYQYFHDEYSPDKVVMLWESLGNTAIPIVSDFEAFYSIRILNAEVAGLRIYEYRNYPAEAGQSPLIVVDSADDLERIARRLNLDPSTFKKVADTGYFDVYARTR